MLEQQNKDDFDNSIWYIKHGMLYQHSAVHLSFLRQMQDIKGCLI